MKINISSTKPAGKTVKELILDKDFGVYESAREPKVLLLIMDASPYHFLFIPNATQPTFINEGNHHWSTLLWTKTDRTITISN